MSSYIRRIARKAQRRNGTYEGKPQTTFIGEFAYTTLRTTRGWTRISNIRVAAQMKMGLMMGTGPLPARPPRILNWLRWNDEAELRNFPVPPCTMTRQQRRAAARGCVRAVA